jgi:hypothetical protein
MAGKTTIDTDLRNEVVKFLAELANSDVQPVGIITIKERAKELYWAVKPQRSRGHRPVKEEAPPFDQGKELVYDSVENIQSSQ